MKRNDKQKKDFEESESSQEIIDNDATTSSVEEQTFENYSQPTVVENNAPSEEPSVIGEKTELSGDIESECDLLIYGKVNGNIKCENHNVNVYGEVDGVIHCIDTVLEHATIRNDIVCSGNFKMDNGSTVEGNIQAEEIYINGEVKGDINAGDILRLGKSAVVIGSISAVDIEIERGAVMQGGLMIRQDM